MPDTRQHASLVRTTGGQVARGNHVVCRRGSMRQQQAGEPMGWMGGCMRLVPSVWFGSPEREVRGEMRRVRERLCRRGA